MLEGMGQDFQVWSNVKNSQCSLTTSFQGSPRGNREESKILYIKHLEPCQVHSVIEMLGTVTGKGH